MTVFQLALLVLVIGAAFFYFGRRQVLSQNALSQSMIDQKAGSKPGLHSLPHYYGLYAAILSTLPALFLMVLMVNLDDVLFRSLIFDFYPADMVADPEFNEVIALAQIANYREGITFGEPPQWVVLAGDAWDGWQATSDFLVNLSTLAVSLFGGVFAYRQLSPAFRSRNAVERIVMMLLAASSAIAILTTIGIVFSVIFESFRFFALVPVSEFLFGVTWNPQFEGAERAGSAGATPEYGSIPLFAGTFLISAIALSVSVPVGLASAIYLSEYASKRTRSIVKPLMEILAGVPTVVYGFFAALTVAPFVRSTGMSLGLDVASESALAAGLVMGIMIIPFVSSLSDDVINAVPQALRDAAFGLGSTKSETVRQVILPAALPGVVASILLAVSRAVGETMIVVMAAGLAANLSANPLDAVTTVTSQIVTILVGDQEFESAKTLSAFALALTLIVITLGLNFIALQIVKKYREQYD